jgi:hypothetical protein
VVPVPKGRLKGRAGSAVPGLILLTAPVPNVGTLPICALTSALDCAQAFRTDPNRLRMPILFSGL